MTDKQILRFNNKIDKVLGFAQELIRQEKDKEKIKKIYELAIFIQKNISYKYIETVNQELN